jgi:hypothetical protein
MLKFIETVLKCGVNLKLKSSIDFKLFEKVENQSDVLQIFEIFIREIILGEAPALQVPRAKTSLAVCRSLPYQKQ